MFAKAFIIASFCVAASLQNWITDIRSCGKGVPIPEEFYLENCLHYPCPFYLGYRVNAAMGVTAPHNVTGMTIEVKFSLWGDFFIPWALPNSDACIRPDSDISNCPYYAGQKISHSTSMPVPSLPLKQGQAYDVTIQYSLYDQHNNVLCCLRAPAQVLKHPLDQN